MTNQRRTAAAMLAGLFALGGTACGGSGKHSTATTTTTTTSGKTAPAAKSSAHKTTKAAAKPKSSYPPLSATPVRTLSFSGTGVKDIGKPAPLRIPTNSTIEWTNTGALFQIIPASVHVQSPVNSTAHSGQAPIRKGAYYGFLVNAIGNWTIKIVPGG
jgi:hypothetical protein